MYTNIYFNIVFFSALIAGVVVSILVAVVLLSLVGGVVAVVLRARRKTMMEAGQSDSKAEDSTREQEGNNILYQNVQSQLTPATGPSEPNYATAADAFTNPASATAPFKTNMCEIDQPTDIGGGGVYEEARVEWSSGGRFEEPVKGVSEKQKKSAIKKVNAKFVKPEDLYAEPNKVKKKDPKKDSPVSRSEEAAAPSDALYAQPDLTKKKNQKGQQDVVQESKLPPQAPLPYKKHKEEKHDGEEDGEDVPELPPLYVSDEEQHCNTGDGDGPSSMERKFEYAVLDWHKK